MPYPYYGYTQPMQDTLNQYKMQSQMQGYQQQVQPTDSRIWVQGEVGAKSYLVANGNTVELRQAGYYEIDAQIVTTGVAVGNVTASLLANGTALTEAQAIETVGATTDSQTLTIHDVVKIEPQNTNSYAKIALQLSVAGTITSGLITVKAVR